MSKYMLRRPGAADKSGPYRLNLQACLEVVLEQSDQVMNEILTGLQAATVPVMGHKVAAALDPQGRYSIGVLVAHATALKQSFAQQLRKSVFGGETGTQAPRQSMRFDDFQFLDADQLDANIEVAQCQQNVQLAVEDVLPAFNAMVSNLMGWSSVQAHLNPLKPEAFVQAMRGAFETLVPDRAARSTVLTVASGLLGVSLRHLYTDTTEWLRALGVEPVHMASTKSTGLWNPVKAPPSTVSRTMVTLDRLRRLLTGELDPNPVAPDRIDFAHTIPSSLEALQDMKLVEPMMKRLSDRAARSGAAAPSASRGSAPVVDMLAAAPEAQSHRELGAQLGREVVLLMLDNLMRDRRLLAPVRASLRAMEPVLIRLALQDGRFFSERQHPARLFLDRITHRSLGFAAEAAPGYARFQKSFDNAVSVLSGGTGDAAAFARVLRKLEEAWEQEEAEQHQRASEAARGLLRAEQRNLLAQRVSAQLMERLQGLEVPDMVRAFLRGTWAQVVAEAQLRFADGSVDPGGYLALVDDLLWSVQLRLTRNNRTRLVHMVPEMLVTMRRGLDLISYPHQRMVAFFDALVAHQEQAFGGPAADASGGHAATASDGFWVVDSEAADSGYMDAESAAQTPPVHPNGPGVAADRRFWQVESLGNGVWVDLAVAGAWVRAQLAWASPQRTLFMFTAADGSAHSMSRQTLDAMKAAGLIRMVSVSRVMDNALDAIARTALQNALEPPDANQIPAADE